MFSVAQIYFEQADFERAFTELIGLVREYPLFWDAWNMIVNSVRTVDQVH